MCENKKTRDVTVWMDDELFADMAKLADADDRKLSKYIERVLRLHVYGHGARARENKEGPERGE